MKMAAMGEEQDDADGKCRQQQEMRQQRNRDGDDRYGRQRPHHKVVVRGVTAIAEMLVRGAAHIVLEGAGPGAPFLVFAAPVVVMAGRLWRLLNGKLFADTDTQFAHGELLSLVRRGR